MFEKRRPQRRAASSCASPRHSRCIAAATLPLRADTVLTPETLRRRLQEMTVFVATEKSGEIVGTIAYSVVNPEEGHIRGMAILPSAQGSGIAARLLTHAEAYFRQRNCARISLGTTAPSSGPSGSTKGLVSLRRGRSGTSLACLYTSTSKPFDHSAGSTLRLSPRPDTATNAPAH